MRDLPAPPLTPVQAAELSGRSYDHIHKAMKSRALKATQAYRHAPWQIDPEDLRVWIAQGRPARPITTADASYGRAS